MYLKSLAIEISIESEMVFEPVEGPYYGRPYFGEPCYPGPCYEEEEFYEFYTDYSAGPLPIIYPPFPPMPFPDGVVPFPRARRHQTSQDND